MAGRVLAALVFTAVAGGCSGGKGSASGGTSGASAPVDGVAFCGALHVALVDYSVRCYAGVRAPVEAVVEPSWRCDGVANALATGTATYDRQQGGACLDWLAALPCGRDLLPSHSAGPCDRALAGTRAVGDACWVLDSDLALTECASPGTCDTSMTCPGVCRSSHAIGEACGSDSMPCQRGSFCGRTTPSDPTTCQALAAAGQRCLVAYQTPPNDPTSLTGVDVCVDGYHCDETTELCVADAPDDPCIRRQPTCAKGLCRQTLSSTDASSVVGIRETCVPYPRPGEPCLAIDEQRGEYRCGAGASCVEGTCVAQALPGESCATAMCAVGAATCGSDQTCQATTPRGGGTGCSYDLPCGHANEPCCFCLDCASVLQCGAGLTCQGTTCIAT